MAIGVTMGGSRIFEDTGCRKRSIENLETAQERYDSVIEARTVQVRGRRHYGISYTNMLNDRDGCTRYLTITGCVRTFGLVGVRLDVLQAPNIVAKRTHRCEHCATNGRLHARDCWAQAGIRIDQAHDIKSSSKYPSFLCDS